MSKFKVTERVDITEKGKEEELPGFWMLEITNEENGKERKEQYVFQTESEAIDDIVGFLAEEEDISQISPTKYNLQKFGFGEGFKIQPVSWFKIVASFAKKSRS
jgi:hypothetical protein